MKRINLIPTLFISLFLVTFSFAQNQTFVDRAPDKISKTEKPKSKISKEADVEVLSYETKAKDIQAKLQNDFDPNDYCEASGGGDEYIDGVALGEISNLNTGYNTGYEDFTNLSAFVVAGITYTMTLYTGNNWASDDYGIWIDWNIDGLFDTVSENVVCEIDNGQEVHNFDITVPQNVVPGNTTMRIRLKYGYSDCGAPCDSTLYGEVEDYGINIIGSYNSYLNGYVFDTITGEPIEGAFIEYSYGSALSAFDGYYSMDDIIPGPYPFTCSKSGYEEKTVIIDNLPNQTNEFDFYLIPVFLGNVEGYLTDCVTSEPIENGDINLGETYSTTTGPDGYFIIEDILAGEWELNYSAPGYCPPQEQLMITIIEGQTTTIENLCLYPLGFEVDPLTINVELEPNGQTTEILTLSNTGLCDVEWSATVLFNNENGTDELFDLIWEMPVGVGGGEAGIETNGNFIYTTKWNGTGEYYRYAMDGTYIEEIFVTGAEATRDMAFDGTFFYGGPASPTVYQLDLDNAALISTFIAPTNVRAIAYNENEDVFYANNWGYDIVKFDMSGANLGSFPCGPVGDDYYGFAFDNSEGIPYLWGYAEVGATQNELIQIALPSGAETGLTFDIGSSLSAYDLAGGLAIDDNIVNGLWVFLGTCQNVNIWTAELNPTNLVWLILEPSSGILSGGSIEEIYLPIYATNLLPGNYQAEIHFTTEPNINVPIVDVSLEVIGFVPPINLTGYYDCTHVYFSWEMPAGNNPTSFNIYRDGAFIGSVIDTEYYEAYVIPEVEYCYQVTAVYEVGESMPTPEFCITVPTPDDIEPYDLEGIPHYPNEFDVTLLWEEPIACLVPDGYNIYRDSGQINGSLVTELTYIDVGLTEGFYEYWVTAVYYFGESEFSDPTYVLFYGTDEIGIEQCRIFPNPAKRLLNVQSDFKIKLLQIYDNQGQIIFAETLNQSNTQIDVSKFESGVYFVQLEIEEKTILRKIVVE